MPSPNAQQSHHKGTEGQPGQPSQGQGQGRSCSPDQGEQACYMTRASRVMLTFWGMNRPLEACDVGAPAAAPMNKGPPVCQ